MASHTERVAAARGVADYICSRTDDELAMPVPNCPGWTVYNAAVHIGRVAIAWQSMITSGPDDPESRTRGYAEADRRGSGHAPDVLASWVHQALDALDDEVDRPAYFSMTGGHGTVGLWGWHAASELGIHRLDVEHALGVPYAMSHELAVDALDYTCAYFLPAMARAADAQAAPVALTIDNAPELTLRVDDDAAEPVASVAGEPVDVLLAMWGRSHGPIDIVGDADTVALWQAMPAQAFQFGTWD